MFIRKVAKVGYLALLFLMSAAISAPAAAWWNDAWPYRLPVSVDTTAASGAGLAEQHDGATVLVKLHTGNFEDFFLVKEDLSDLRFVDADDKTPLKHHVEYFDLLSQLAYIWVQVPEIKPGISTGKIWMYYGNSEAQSSDDSAASYDKNTAAVYHFSDAAGAPLDASAYQNNAASFSGAIESSSVIAGGIRLAAGTNVIINDAASFAVDPSLGMTVSFWMKASGTQGDAWLVHRSDGASDLVVGVQQNAVYARLRQNDGSEAELAPVAAITPDTWQHVTLVIASNKMQLLVDGNTVAETTISLQGFGGSWAIGSSLQGSNGFVGNLDELRIDNVARTADWAKMALGTQAMNSRLLSYQPGEQLGAGGGETSTFFSVIFGSTEASGWTVVILLGIMASVSWVVMIGKALFLRSVRKDNLRFLDQYAEMGDGDPGMLDHEDSEDEKAMYDSPITQAIFGDHDHFQSSPIYRVYHRGIEQVHARMGKAAGAQASNLSSGALGAIKASINTQMVREVQRMNSKMVLLTIAISGGPFLGLFGTVLGVMITFASIAATGDVNIAAIAPGVAAALLTTIVGLIVAIPAMFAYNWLQTRIKENVAEMRVFSDEFMTRLAEYYGDTSV